MFCVSSRDYWEIRSVAVYVISGGRLRASFPNYLRERFKGTRQETCVFVFRRRYLDQPGFFSSVYLQDGDNNAFSVGPHHVIVAQTIKVFPHFLHLSVRFSWLALRCMSYRWLSN